MPRRKRPLLSATLLPVALLATLTATAAPTSPARLTLVPVDSEPRDGREKPDAATLTRLRQDVEGRPDDRTRRLALVRALLAAKDHDGALAAAEAWRAKDAYNLVAVRALGDVHMERGEKAKAERVYSAIVELLPKDPDAQRALATLLKARGDLAAARPRLEAAIASRANDARLAFELADVELRLGDRERAAARLEEVIAASETPEQIRYPAKQRLAQILGEARRQASARGDDEEASKLSTRIAAFGLRGSLENDVHVYLTWDTDRTDVDLWVTTPSGEKVFYSHRKGKGGEALFDDVTNGYGPESFTAHRAAPGEYVVQVDYYSARRGPFPEARGEVVVVLDEGRPTERRHVLPYRLYAEKQNVTVARVQVGGGR